MKKEKSATSRVKSLIAKATPESSADKKLRNYKHEQMAPIPSGIEGLTFSQESAKQRKIGVARVIPQKSGKSSLEQLHCTHNQNYPLFFIEKAEAFQLKNIQSLRIKERIIAARNIKTLSMEIQKWIHTQILQKVTVHNEDALEFQNLIERREERHFRIDRIIKCLSDF